MGVDDYDQVRLTAAVFGADAALMPLRPWSHECKRNVHDAPLRQSDHSPLPDANLSRYNRRSTNPAAAAAYLNEKMHPSCGGPSFTLYKVTRRSRVILTLCTNMKLASTIAVLSLCLLAAVGCQEDRDTYAIQNLQATYDAWLITVRPKLNSIPKTSIHEYQFTTYHSEGKVRPIVDYYIKLGDWDGMLNITYILDVDANRNPTKIHEERITFIELPARRTVLKSHLENQYFGFSLEAAELDAILQRVNDGDQFTDLLVKAKQSGEFVFGTPAETDDWVDLRP